MLYLPKPGQMWDPSIVVHEGKYYLFSMFRFHGGDERHVWCAVSEDGVHFSDVGAVITDTMIVWKMFVRRFGDQFVMNYGSLSGREGHGNDTLRFHTSRDLLHWDFRGQSADSHPDPRWYCPQGRWDHMYSLEHEGRFYGFVVATADERQNSFGCGMMESSDGLNWRAMPPLRIDWGDVEPVHFEVGGCENIGGRYYLIGGTGCYGGSMGYSVFTFVADSPLGPYRPCPRAYRLCGSSRADALPGVQWLASFGRGRDGEVLITNYVTAGRSDTPNFINTKQNVWLTPIKQAVTDAHGALRMGWWPANDALKGADRTPAQLRAGLTLTCTRDANGRPSPADDEAFGHYKLPAPGERGLFVEGAATLRGDGHRNAARFGFAFQGDDAVRTVTVQMGRPAYTRARIHDQPHLGSPTRTLVDEVEPFHAGKTNVEKDTPFTFKLLCRAGMFELYIDGLLVQTHLTPEGTSEVCVYIENAHLAVERLAMYDMTL